MMNFGLFQDKFRQTRLRQDGFSFYAKSPSRAGIPRGAVEELPRIFRFAADAGERGDATLDVTTGCFFGRAEERRDGRLRGKRPVLGSLAGGLDYPWGLTQNILHSESAGGGGAGLFLHAQNYFWPTATKTATRP